MAGIASPVFSKRERIVSRKLIEQLFSKGSSFSVSAFPLRIVVLETKRVADDIPVQVLISVSKRHFKHAVDRNRVKRQVREAYRHHKQILTEKVQQEQTLAIAFIWLADELLESATVEKSVKRLLGKAAERL
jgi:ribonuclease P protein component